MKHALLFFAYATLNAIPAVAFHASILTLVCSCIRRTIAPAVNFFIACFFLACLCCTVITIKKHLQTSAALVAAMSPEAIPLDVSHASFLMLLSAFLMQSSLAPFVA